MRWYFKLFLSWIFKRCFIFVRLLAGSINPDDEDVEMPKLNVSYKPQKVSPSFPGTVRQLLHAKIQKAYAKARKKHLPTISFQNIPIFLRFLFQVHPQFIADVIKPLKVTEIMDRVVKNLSGGEIQRVALALCLGKPADVYLIDEPSAYKKVKKKWLTIFEAQNFIFFTFLLLGFRAAFTCGKSHQTIRT